jgi:hypothetical protein
MSTYVRPDATLPAIAEFGGRASMSANEIGNGWSTTSQTRPPADKFNERDFLTSSAMKYLCRLGIAEYSPDESYQGRGMCIGSNGSIYWNLVPCQGVDPVSDTMGYWEKCPVRYHDAQDLIAGMAGGFLTMAQAQAAFVDWGTFWNNINAHWAHITQAEQNIDWVSGRVTTLEGWRSGVDGWIGTRNNNFDELFWWRDQHTGQINDLYGRANNADQGIANVNGRVDGLMPQVQGGETGYMRLPGGVLQQWVRGGNLSLPNGWVITGQRVNFPVGFASVWSVQVTTGRISGQNNQIGSYQIQSWDNGGVNLQAVNRGDMAPMTLWPMVYAIGN